MYIYSPDRIRPDRLEEAEAILSSLGVKHAFITGSFLYAKSYNDIDLFILSRSKKALKLKDHRLDVHVIDFNQASSLFYHSATKLCVSASLLPRPHVRLTLAAYWQAIVWALTPTSGVQKRKEWREIVLMTEYFKGSLLDSKDLHDCAVVSREELVSYLEQNAPAIFAAGFTRSSFRRFFYGLESHYAQAHPSIRSIVRLVIAGRDGPAGGRSSHASPNGAPRTACS